MISQSSEGHFINSGIWMRLGSLGSKWGRGCQHSLGAGSWHSTTWLSNAPEWVMTESVTMLLPGGESQEKCWFSLFACVWIGWSELFYKFYILTVHWNLLPLYPLWLSLHSVDDLLCCRENLNVTKSHLLFLLSIFEPLESVPESHCLCLYIKVIFN